MKEFIYSTIGILAMVIIVLYAIFWVRGMVAVEPVVTEAIEVKKYCTVETAQFGESLIVEGEKYGGDLNVIVTPSGGVYVTAPCSE